jgi:glycosyltransferase involved in cell wall biosynthesis
VKRPIRTLLFSTLFPSSVRPLHGIFVETRLRELLRSGRVETRVVAPVPWFPSTHPRWGEYASFAQTPARERRNGIDVLHPRYPLLPKIGMSSAPWLLARAAASALQRVIDEGFDFDVIDAHYYYPDGVAAALLARRFGKPLAITARGTDLNLIPQHVLPRQMMRWAARRADASIGVCNALVDVLRDWGIEERRLHVMRNGVDLQRFRLLPQDDSRRELGIVGGPVLLSVGHLIERKGHDLALAAMPAVLQQHPQAQLLIIGEGEERGRLQTQIESLALGAHARLIGAVPNDHLATWYSAANALILASSREGWANVLLEAMACGTPVVATRTWGTPEVVAEEAVGLLVERRDGEALGAALLRLLAVPRDRERVRRYAEGFGWDVTTRAQVELFDHLAATGAAR